MLALPKLKTSAKSVQTTAEVWRDYTCSLYRLQLKSPESTTYLQIYVRALIKISTRKHFSKYAYLLKRVRRTDIAFELVAEEPFRAMKKYRAYGTHNAP